MDPLWDREPVEVLKDKGDVVTEAGVGEQASSRVLHAFGVYLGLGMMHHKEFRYTNQFRML